MTTTATTANDFSRWKRLAWPETVPWVVVESDLTSDPECPRWFVDFVDYIAEGLCRTFLSDDVRALTGVEWKSKGPVMANYLNAALTLIGYSEDC
jgi:hypothetical protein